MTFYDLHITTYRRYLEAFGLAFMYSYKSRPVLWIEAVADEDLSDEISIDCHRTKMGVIEAFGAKHGLTCSEVGLSTRFDDEYRRDAVYHTPAEFNKEWRKFMDCLLNLGLLHQEQRSEYRYIDYTDRPTYKRLGE